MLYVNVNRSYHNNSVISARVATEDEIKLATAFKLETRNDWKTFAAAKEVAAHLGKEFIATDAGQFVSPRYDVVKLPKVGNKVSKSFNGDSYPCGVIVRVSKTFRTITTDGGDVFYRVGQSGSWRNEGTWFLTQGHINERNPSF